MEPQAGRSSQAEVSRTLSCTSIARELRYAAQEVSSCEPFYSGSRWRSAWRSPFLRRLRRWIRHRLRSPLVPLASWQLPISSLTAKTSKVDINVNRGGGKWYANPIWMAIGGLAVLVLLILIVMAVRGGGTTIVKE